jgi:manganese/zinc/iron transport system substrate-binding protein
MYSVLARVLALTIIISLLTACSQVGEQATAGDLSGRKIRVVATTSMISDLARTIGGERVEVTGLMGPGVDPHLYKASAGDVTRLEQADIVFYNGLHLEAAMGEVFEKMHGKVKTVAVTDTIPRDLLLAPPEF